MPVINLNERGFGCDRLMLGKLDIGKECDQIRLGKELLWERDNADETASDEESE